MFVPTRRRGSETASTVFFKRPGSESSRFGADCVVLDPSGKLLRGFNLTAARIWELVDGRRSAGQIAEQLAAEFAVPLELARSDVLTFLANLESKALVEEVVATSQTARSK